MLSRQSLHRRIEQPYLEELRDLNQLFLSELKRRADDGEECFGLPPAARRALKRAGTDKLEQAAGFPCALFRVALAAGERTSRFDVHDGARERTVSTSLMLTILLCIWNLCRTHSYAARAHFGLSLQEVESLRRTPLTLLPELSQQARLAASSFDDAGRFWRELLVQGDSKRRRNLVLVGLQPAAERPSAVLSFAERSL